MQKQFYSTEGSLAFVIPFLFTPEKGEGENVCSELFSQVKPDDDRDRYEDYKDELRKALSNQFPDADIAFCGATEFNDGEVVKRCRYREDCHKHEPYKGRNLCPCLSVSRKFHDDASQKIPRIEISLGTYHVLYEKDEEHFFECYIDALLLLTNATGGEGGYLVFNTSLAAIRENCFGSVTGNKLENFIFLKHLFYKGRLKCSINDQRNISIQEWASQFYRTLLAALDIKNDKQEVSFNYSIMELNDIVDSEKKPISLARTSMFLKSYRNQVYGLMVSDEGWRYIADNTLKKPFKDNNWSSRNFSTAFFLGHNALIINQYHQAKTPDSQWGKAYTSFSKEWYDNYGQTGEQQFYAEYARLRPCIPGVASMIFYAFLKAIYKEVVLDKVKELTDGSSFTDEEKYRRLAFALQQHSMSLDAIKNVEECIYAQFDIPAQLQDIRLRYKQEAANVQNRKVVNLTHVTACISLSALVVATLAIGTREGLSMYSAGMNWTVAVLVLSLLIPLAIYIIILNNLWDKFKKKKS